MSSNSASQALPTEATSQQPVVAAVPPTVIRYGNTGHSIRARIDRNVPVEEVIRQIHAVPQLNLNGGPEAYVLREAESDELITPANLQQKLEAGTALCLVSAPTSEAIDLIRKLRSCQNVAVKQATFVLAQRMEDISFVQAFTDLDGPGALLEAVHSSSGNALAYALTAIQSLLEADFAYDMLDVAFASRIMAIIVSEQLVNIARPALQIVRLLMMVDSTSSSGYSGFDEIWPLMSEQTTLFPTLARHLTRGSDKHLIAATLTMLSAAFANVSAAYLIDVFETAEANKLRKSVISLMENRSEDIENELLEFQTQLARFYFRLQSSAPDLGVLQQMHMLDIIYKAARLSSDCQGQLEESKFDYARFGFSGSSIDAIQGDFKRYSAGMLGLLISHDHARNRGAEFSALVGGQQSQDVRYRCPIAAASLIATRVLSAVFELGDPSGAAAFRTLQLDFLRLHFVLLQFFVRMYNAASAQLQDLDKVAALVEFHATELLNRNVNDFISPLTGQREAKSYYTIKQEFEASAYDDVRDRYRKELDVADDLYTKMPIRALRDRLYRENFELVKEQRMLCMQQGAWFLNARYKNASMDSSLKRSSVTQYKFCRLSNNRRHIYWLDAAEMREIKAGLEELLEKIDVRSITEIAQAQKGQISSRHHRSGSGVTLPSVSDGSLRSPPPLEEASATLHITLFHSNGATELIAPDAAIYCEWVDGLKLLTNGYVVTQTSADFVQTLTDVGVRIRLLDLAGECVEIPSNLAIPPVPPRETSFFYAH